MFEAISEFGAAVIDPFVNPQKRVFLGYIASAFVIALAAQVIIARKTLGFALSNVFARDVWLSRSARADYLILFLNQFIMMGAAPRLITKLAVATLLFEHLHIWMDGRPQILTDAPAWAIAAAFTTVLFLADDLSKYLLHRAMHRWAWLWAFHEVHHSAETMTPLTVYRTHPVEGLLFALRAVFVQGVVVALFVFFMGPRAELMTVLGANAFLFFFNLLGANLRHSHIWISYGAGVERWLISPAQHQIHHSVAVDHHDRNFGAVLAVWDRLGGSLCVAAGQKPPRFGVDPDDAGAHRLGRLYITPFTRAAGALSAGLKRRLHAMAQLKRGGAERRTPFIKLALALVLTAAAAAAGFRPAAAAELNVYSHRQPFLIEPFLKAYEAETGTKINVVFASKGLAQRLLVEGENSPADVVLTVDIARLSLYADKDLLAPVSSETLERNIPAHLRAPDDRWFAFSKRARVIAVSKATPDAKEIRRYEDLADPKWEGRICSRPGSHVYNRALVASVVHAAGVEGADAWASGVVGNLARRPQGNDRAQIKAIYEGLCDIAIINNYYFGKLMTSDIAEQRDWAASVDLIFPNQDDRGAHVNISGGGVAKHSKNKAEAVRFLEFLTSPAAQALYGEINFEYPVNPAVEPPEMLRSLGAFKEDTMPIAAIAELASEAQKVIDRAGW